MRTCYIFGAAQGLPERFIKQKEDLLIAADAGLLWLRDRGIAPDLAVGDFDSAGFVPDGCEVLRFPVKKDDTDSMLAVKEGFKRGFSHFVLYGCYGERPDHTFSNYQLLTFIARKGGTGMLCCGDFYAAVLRNGSIAFSDRAAGNFSLFSLTPRSTGLTVSGGLYELENGELCFDSSLGQSNAFVGKPVRVSVTDGTVLVFWQGDRSAVETYENRSNFVKADSISS